MKKLSVKLGVLFFLNHIWFNYIYVFLLHSGIAKSRIEEELQNLQSREFS